MSAQKGPDQTRKSGQGMAKRVLAMTGRTPGPTRFHIDYWRQRIYHKSYTRHGKRYEIPEWSVRMQHLGRREAFSLGTANAAAAAVEAKKLATLLQANGWEATLATYKPDPLAKAVVCTVGDFLADVEKRSHLKASTVYRYAVKFRKLVVDVAKLESRVPPKEKRTKFDYHGGGRTRWQARIHAQKLDILTAESVTAWRNSYVNRAGSNPLRRKSAERSAASIIRSSRALFSPDVVAHLRVKVPPNPFVGVKLGDPGPQRYVSDVRPELLLVAAKRELKPTKPELYAALVLCLWAGLRRKEADLLMWEQIDLGAATVNIRRTVHFEPKTEDSQREVDIGPEAVEILRALKVGCTSAFVLKGGDPNPEAKYDFYRCNVTWVALLEWLRSKGVRQTKAVHMLRKESGSIIASDFGIEHARRHLGHTDIRTTSNHYVAKRHRVEVSFPSTSQLTEVANEG